MPRGGKRPGAGAPKRNFNAIKTGKYSQRLYLLAVYLLANPVIRMFYKRLCANLVIQGLSPNPDPLQPAPRGFIGVFVDGKCRCLYLAPKNIKNQSNFVFFIYTKNWGPDRNNQTIPPSKRAQHVEDPRFIGAAPLQNHPFPRREGAGG